MGRVREKRRASRLENLCLQRRRGHYPGTGEWRNRTFVGAPIRPGGLPTERGHHEVSKRGVAVVRGVRAGHPPPPRAQAFGSGAARAPRYARGAPADVRTEKVSEHGKG